METITAAFAAGTLCRHRAPGSTPKAITVVQLRALILASGGKPAGARAVLVDTARLLCATTTGDTTSASGTTADTSASGTTGDTSGSDITGTTTGDTDSGDQDGPDGGGGGGTPAGATAPATAATSPPTTHACAAFRDASENALLSSPRF